MEVTEIEGVVKTINLEDDKNLIVFEITSNNTTKKIELLNNASSQLIYKYIKIGDKLHKDKNTLRINVVRIESSVHVQVRYFDINCSD